MERTGTLTISQGTSRLDGMLLGRSGNLDPLSAATAFLTDKGFRTNDFIKVTGTDGEIGGAAVMFITDAAMAAVSAMVGPTAFAANAAYRQSGATKKGKSGAKAHSGKTPSRKASKDGAAQKTPAKVAQKPRASKSSRPSPKAATHAKGRKK